MPRHSLGKWLPLVFLGSVALWACDEETLRPIPTPEEPAAEVWSPPQENPPEVTERPPVARTCPPYCPEPATKLTRVDVPNPIPAENQKAGDPDWRSGLRAKDGQLEVYADSESVTAGQTLALKVSTDQKATVTAELYRIGFYGGAGARKVWTGGPWTVTPQSACGRDPVTALVECDWNDTFKIPIASDWVSGLYVVKVKRSEGYKRFHPIVVRDARKAEILYTPNFTTYQAYNTWGGESLYFDGSGKMPSGRAWQVSFNRPYASSEGGGKTFNLDLALIQFIERHGYDVTYGTQLDFLRYENFVEDIDAFVHGAQDEYWPAEERAQIDAALESGNTSLAYFGGNGAYWRVRVTSDRHGRPLRTMHCYKSEPSEDPVPYSTVRYRDAPNAQPEQNLFGVMYEGWQLVPFPLIVGDPSHWLFAGTGLQAGTQLRNLVGYEYDRGFTDHAGYPAGVQVAMTSPVVSAEGIPSYATSADRTLPKGNVVFAAGTIWYALALLNDPELHDARVERMTLNVLERALSHARPVRKLSPATSDFPAEATPNGLWAQSVSHFVGTVGQAGYVDGPMTVARFRAPTGLAATSVGELIVADTGNNRLRRVLTDPQRTVETLAGNGDLGYRDGPAADAMFRMPTDVAVGPSGEIYVADSDNHVIRRIDHTAAGFVVSTVAGKGFTSGFSDGSATQARFNRPTAIDVDAQGNVYVADQANNRIRMIRHDTREVTTIAGTGGHGRSDATIGSQATFSNPSAMTLGPAGELYVMDAGNQLVRRIHNNAVWTVDTIAGNSNAWYGFADGAGNVARFSAQMGMAYSPDGDVIVADTANYRIRKIVAGLDASTTSVYTLAGTGRLGTRVGPGQTADIVAPTGLAFGPNGLLYVSDSFHHVIREIVR